MHNNLKSLDLGSFVYPPCHRQPHANGSFPSSSTLHPTTLVANPWSPLICSPSQYTQTTVDTSQWPSHQSQKIRKSENNEPKKENKFFYIIFVLCHWFRCRHISYKDIIWCVWICKVLHLILCGQFKTYVCLFRPIGWRIYGQGVAKHHSSTSV